MKERLVNKIFKAYVSLFNYPRNKIFSYSFKAENLKIGKNPNIIGSQNIEVGDDVNIGHYSWIEAIGDGVIIIEDCVSLSSNVHIASVKKVVLKHGCLIGSDVYISDHDHGDFTASDLKKLPALRKLRVKGNTIVERNVWIGDNVKVLSGVTIGEGSVVAANSVVINSVPPYSLVAGVPAVIKKEFYRG